MSESITNIDDELDHILAICACLPPHDYAFSVAAQKAEIQKLITNKIKEAELKAEIKLYDRFIHRHSVKHKAFDTQYVKGLKYQRKQLWVKLHPALGDK